MERACFLASVRQYKVAFSVIQVQVCLKSFLFITTIQSTPAITDTLGTLSLSSVIAGVRNSEVRKKKYPNYPL